MTNQLEQLQAEFSAAEHKSRPQGGKALTYIAIDATINRVNAVLGANWSVVPPTSTTLLPITDSEGSISKYIAKCELFIEAEIDGVKKTLYGFGAMVNADPDMAGKTALAEAIKKAWHQAGVALYLWDPEARDRIAKKSKVAAGGMRAKKKALKDIVVRETGVEKPSLTEIADFFNTPAGDMDDEPTLDLLLGDWDL